VIGVARTCNLILIVLDAGKPMTHKKILEIELEGFGIRLNKSPPNIIFKKKVCLVPLASCSCLLPLALGLFCDAYAL
jgi:hypothetical protein